MTTKQEYERDKYLRKKKAAIDKMVAERMPAVIADCLEIEALIVKYGLKPKIHYKYRSPIPYYLPLSRYK